MVMAILDGRKTQTRRIVKQQPLASFWISYACPDGRWNWVVDSTGMGSGDPFSCPYGQPSDRIWVRETLRISERSYSESSNHLLSYRSSHVPVQIADTDDKRQWVNERITNHIERAHDAIGLADFHVPSIHMPRWACRLLLDVKAVRVERLQDMTIRDAIREGIDLGVCSCDGDALLVDGKLCPPHVRRNWIDLWDSLNEKRGFGWDTNPWVWVITFDQTERS